VSDELLDVLKFCLLALLYLFFFRVLRAVWAEIKPPAPASADATRPVRRESRPASRAPARSKRGMPGALVIVEPEADKGRRYTLGDEVTVGRAAGCQVTVDDTYVSQLHARVFQRDGQVFVEDLGSTNGTYLNRSKVSGPMLVQRGDRLQVGNTVMEAS
jgi:pSer/pThr/pTyr-binding forkhead associated (FHA) protein